MSQFDDYAVEKINNLLATRGAQVGRKYTGNKGGKDETDCITFVTQVLVYAYEKLGKRDVAREVRKRAAKGTDLARFLVEKRLWHAHYWNPDVRRPRDQKSEHPFGYQQAVKGKKYYDIPLSGAIIDFNPTPVPAGKVGTKLKSVVLSRFKLVPFAVGVARGGDHTFLCSLGKVYEVHWGGIGDSLYEVSEFATYPWLSGVVVVPPKTSFKSEAL